MTAIKPRFPEDKLISHETGLTNRTQITKRNRIGEAGLNGAGCFQALIENSQDLITILDGDGTVRYESPILERVLGDKPTKRVGQNILELVHPDDRPDLASIFRPGGQRVSPTAPVNVRFQHKDGSWRIFEAVTTDLLDEPTVAGIVIDARDITERVQADMARERELRQRISSQERLAAMGQLTAGIAHDFNNILTSIIGFSELLKERSSLPELDNQRLATIIKQGQHAAHLVRQILHFSSQSTVDMQAVELAPLVEEMIPLLQRTIPESIKINLQIEPGQYRLKAVTTDIQRMLTNLAVNARDAMPVGGVLQFRLSTLILPPGERPSHPEMTPGDWLVLSVADTGQGIPSQNLPQIFEPFFTTKEKDKGTGLGLAQVYGIVKQHQGHIDVVSQMGNGTTFTVYLPALASTQTSLSQISPPENLGGHGEVILVVEDAPTVLETAKELLEHLGYRVLTAPNGRVALEVFDRHQAEITLILTDVTMPEMGGVAFLQVLRKRNPTVKVIALTGYSLEAEEEALQAQGIVGRLEKPVSLNRLARMVRQALNSDSRIYAN